MNRSCEALSLCINNFWIDISDHHVWQLYFIKERPLNILLKQPDITLLALYICKAKPKHYNSAVVIDSCKVYLE